MAFTLIDHKESVRIDRPAETVFAAMADIDGLFAALERKTPITVERLSGAAGAEIGDKWRVSGVLKLGRRTGVVEITDLQSPTRLAFRTKGGGYLTETQISIAPEGEACRLAARNVVTANSLKARLAAPFIRLYRKRIERGFRKLLKRAKRRIEAQPASSLSQNTQKDAPPAKVA